MKKETVKTIVIVFLSLIFVSHSVEKKNIVDELKEDKSFLDPHFEIIGLFKNLPFERRKLYPMFFKRSASTSELKTRVNALKLEMPL